jgi:hypothetical protein
LDSNRAGREEYPGNVIYPRLQRMLEDNLGGKVVGAPSSLTDYLIIAQLGSKDWMHSTHGRKIEKAVKLRDEDNAKIAIISEKHWLDSFNIKNI